MRKVVAGISVGVAAAAIVLLLDAIFSWADADGTGQQPFQSIELKTYDWRLTHTARPETARKDIALVEIDEYSLRNLQSIAGRWPWPRVIHGLLIDFLANAGAKLVVYDVLFTDADKSVGFDVGGTKWDGAESDQALVDAVKKSGHVIALADATYEGAVTQSTAGDVGVVMKAPGVIERKVLFPPFAGLAAEAKGLGHNLLVLDSDGPVRHTVPFVQIGDRVVPSLGVQAALLAQDLDLKDVHIDRDAVTFGDRRMPFAHRRVRTPDGVVEYSWTLVNFRGPALLEDLKSGTYPRYSAFDLLIAENQIVNHEKPSIDPSVFKDKIVFVGVTAAGLNDVFETPFAHGKMPGIQVHAAVADDILSNRFLVEGSSGARVLTVVALAVAAGTVAALLPAWWATLSVVVMVAVLGWVATMLFASGYWLNLSQPVLASSVALLGGVGYQYFVEGREKRKMKTLFGQYVSRDVFEQLVAHPELARLGGQRREMTVLFSDIRGFTTVTERGQPEEIVGMLNEYFTRMVDIVFAHHGTLDKFVGDMVMALFGAPLDDPDHADHAVQAALAMIRELHALNAQWKTQGRFAELDIGIGVNTGPMIAGNIGSQAIMSYTVIGDAVNLGSRLESLNKQYGTRIIISEATKTQLKGRYNFRPLGDVVVKGKTKPVAIFEVVGMDPDEARS